MRVMVGSDWCQTRFSKPLLDYLVLVQDKLTLAVTSSGEKHYCNESPAAIISSIFFGTQLVDERKHLNDSSELCRIP